MKYHLRSAPHLAAVLLACAFARPCAASGNDRGVLVHLQSGADIGAIASRYGAAVAGSLPEQNLYRLQSGSAGDAVLIQQLTADSRVVLAEEDSETSSAEVVGDPFHFSVDINSSPGAFLNAASYVQINLAQAQAQTEGFGVVVAVLDTGVAATHPMLQNNLLTGLNTLQPAAAPADVPDGTNNADAGHGTFIAGLITHLAPHSAILPVRVMDADGKGSVFAAAQGIYYAIAHGAKIITLSLGTTAHSGILQNALDAADAAGVILVAAAGNANANLPQLAVAGHGALVVASVESDNTKSPYSNYGSYIRVVAPGSSVRSAFWNNNYATWSGTSFAAPLVAAEAALILAANPALLSGDVVSIIRNTARSVDKQNPNYRNMLGNGIIDIAAAVKKAGGSGTVPTNAALSGVVRLLGLAPNTPNQTITFTFRPADGSAPFTRTAPTGANSAFTFADLRPAVYTLHVTVDRYLAVNVPLNLTFASVSGLVVELPAGDANGDNVVDIADFGLLVNAYGSDAAIAGSGYDARADFDGNGTVDIGDFGLLVNSYGLQGDS